MTRGQVASTTLSLRASCVGFDGARYAVGAENRRRASRNLGEFLDEAGALGFEIFRRHSDCARSHGARRQAPRAWRVPVRRCRLRGQRQRKNRVAAPKSTSCRNPRSAGARPQDRAIQLQCVRTAASIRTVPGPASFASTLRAKFLDMHRRLRRALHGSAVTCQKSNTFHSDLISRLIEEPVTKVRKRPALPSSRLP